MVTQFNSSVNHLKKPEHRVSADDEAHIPESGVDLVGLGVSRMFDQAEKKIKTLIWINSQRLRV